MKEEKARKQYRTLCRMVDTRLASLVREVDPGQTRQMLRHVLGGGGKRLRSVVLLSSCAASGGSPQMGLNAAAAIELLHSFTLVHDDIMDNARTRRGRPTIHTRWGVGRGILAGDVLLGLAYNALSKVPHTDPKSVSALFTLGLLQVCRGQALDMNLESRRSVRVGEYFHMIELKTSALLSVAAGLGGIIGGGSPGQVEALRSYGHYLGRAFQIQDDLLDVVADEQVLGKKTGGDIREGKKTFLLLRAIHAAKGKDLLLLKKISGSTRNGRGVGRNAVKRVTGIYRELGIIDEARETVRRETARSTHALRSFPENEGSLMLRWIAERMMNRNS